MEGSIMKAMLAITITSLSIILSAYAFAGCGDDSGCGQGYCGSEYDNKCQCTDPTCNKGYGHDCLSKGECCEAFGNIGAR
jgi:hypothetical protein